MTRIGDAVPRLENHRLLRGEGRFHTDVQLRDLLWMRIVRSPIPHGRITRIDCSAARSLPGVAAVLVWSDLNSELAIPARQPTPGIDFTPYLQYPLAREFVRYVGEPVVAVIADSQYVAEDAAAEIVVEYEAIPVLLDARSADGEHVPSLNNAAARVGTIESEYGDVEGAFGDAAHVISTTVTCGRQSGIPLECRGLTASWNTRSRKLTIWGASKVPYWNRRIIARFLGLTEHSIHMTESDVGGSFGIRGELYPEDLLVAWAAKTLRANVRWVEDRREHLIAANHAREQEHDVDLAFDDSGHILAIRDTAWLDSGAWIRTHGAVVAALTSGMFAGPYRVPAFRSTVHVVLTNKTPVGTYRAPGRFQNNYAREHALDLAAAHLQIDPVDLRSMNLLDHTELPMERPMRIFGAPMLLDGTDHAAHLDAAVQRTNYRQWQLDAETARRDGRLVGAGMAMILEKAGLGHDSAVVEIDTTGAIRVAMGGTSVGQGIETAMAQIAADRLGADISQVSVVLSDTDILHDGAGTFASRSTVVGGSAVAYACDQVIERAIAVGATILKLDTSDLVVADGYVVSVSNPRQRVDLGSVSMASTTPAFVATGIEPGLIGRSTYSAATMTYPYGAHFALVEVAPATGVVDVLRYALTFEAGRVVSPEAVVGQLRGGAVQGIGGALFEEMRYSPEGIPLDTSLGDYQLPRALSVPDIEVHVFEDSPAPGNPLGVRGVGEGGNAGVGAALANAVRNALGVTSVPALPMTPERILRLLYAHQQTPKKREQAPDREVVPVRR
ncbi:xanthine dehydrogenase family protein molybdopterin-binding subunit [Rhodococcus sp. IEGM 1330]|uniref:xanthine dehydrogenase family protein molybdopterin-binding subunit n=1 Tax=Rhodococcus sp. IEGM 1330 TaxID=3082225 RepID=UPI002954C065|nr:xanthine dehydrogenase family protein molybdopterin-binding subunit [Rhodococcus sp. IEGM 1330]MDV8022699.1 xanthine dehydrogenase family protein molybdopterin-binding subunit [Rhodococcus sp. IEGM 1330]